MIPLMKNAFLNETETKQKLADFIKFAPQLSMSQQCYQFENEFSKKQGCKHSILFNSGGSANLAMIQSLLNLGYLEKGDNVGFSALTWSTNVMPIIQLGLKPIPIDCHPHTLNVMSEQLSERLNDIELKALFITNTLGLSGDLKKIQTICNENNIILIEDNCESLGTELEEGRTGNFGIMSSFSFFVAHHMSTIEGGMICTNDKNIYDFCIRFRGHGMLRESKFSKVKKTSKNYKDLNEKFIFLNPGFNFRNNEIGATIGINQLKRLNKNIKLRRDKRYEVCIKYS